MERTQKTYQTTALLVRLELNGPVQRINVVCRPPFLRVLELAQGIVHNPPPGTQKPQQRLVVVRRRRARTPQALLLQHSLEALQSLLLRSAQMAQVAVRKDARLAGGRARGQDPASRGRAFKISRHAGLYRSPAA